MPILSYASQICILPEDMVSSIGIDGNYWALLNHFVSNSTRLEYMKDIKFIFQVTTIFNVFQFVDTHSVMVTRISTIAVDYT